MFGRSTSFAGRRRHSYRVEGALIKTGQCRLSFWCNHDHCLWNKTIVRFVIGNCVIQYDTILILGRNLVPLKGNTCGARAVPSDISWISTWCCKGTQR